MRVEFLQREKKTGEIECGLLEVLSLVAMKEEQPNLWSQFINVMNAIDDGSLMTNIRKGQKKDVD